MAQGPMPQAAAAGLRLPACRAAGRAQEAPMRTTTAEEAAALIPDGASLMIDLDNGRFVFFYRDAWHIP